MVELAVEIVSPLIRIIAHFFIEVVVEILIRGAGFIICRPFSKKIEPDDGVVVVVGIVFWIAVAALGIFFFSHFQESLAIES